MQLHGRAEGKVTQDEWREGGRQGLGCRGPKEPSWEVSLHPKSNRKCLSSFKQQCLISSAFGAGWGVGRGQRWKAFFIS